MNSQALTNVLLIALIVIQLSHSGATNRLLQLELHMKGLPTNWRRSE